MMYRSFAIGIAAATAAITSADGTLEVSIHACEASGPVCSLHIPTQDSKQVRALFTCCLPELASCSVIQT